jgi:toxin YhaV
MSRINGWALYAHPLFLDQVNRLIDAVEKEKNKRPSDYIHGANAKVLASILKLCTVQLPADPTLTIYRLGDALGPNYRHWFRAKFGGGRFRLFFRYGNNPNIIIYAWVNDTETKRTYGGKNDAYKVFRSMLGRKNPPDDWEALVTACSIPDGVVEFFLERMRGLIHHR